MTGRTVRAFVWRRSDFRETSRLVTLFTREAGRVHALAKGAHRPTSTFLGRLDFLNLVDATLAGSGAGLLLLSRVRLVHEPRGLREPARFFAANHLAELCDQASAGDRPDPDLFDLLAGGVTLLERCPTAALPAIVLGLELRWLGILGLLPPLLHCSQCGAPAASRRPLHAGRPGEGLLCRHHAAEHREPVALPVLERLNALATQPARAWDSLPVGPELAKGSALVERWVAAALEHRPRFRGAALGRAEAFAPADRAV